MTHENRYFYDIVFLSTIMYAPEINIKNK